MSYIPSDTIDDESFSNNQLLTMHSASILRNAGGWAMFLAILSLVGALFTLLAGLMMMVTGDMLGSINNGNTGMPSGFGIMIGIVYIVGSVIYALPGWYLLQFANRARAARESMGSSQMTEVLSQLRNFFRISGWMVIVFVALYVLFIIVFFVFYASAIGGAAF